MKAIIRLARKMLDGVKFNRYMLRVWILFQIRMKGTISYRRRIFGYLYLDIGA